MATRLKPDFETERVGFRIFIGLFTGTASFAAFVLILFKTIESGGLGYWLLGLLFSVAVLAQSGMILTGVLHELSEVAKKRKWLKQTATTRAMITDREIDVDYLTDEWIGFTLVLKMPDCGPTDGSEQQTVSAKVSKRIYDRYLRLDSARIHYSLTNPCNFILDGE
jgi:hypothetical protein